MQRRMRVPWTGTLLAVGVWASCASEAAPVAPHLVPAPLTATARELSQLPFEALGVTGRDAGYSAKVGRLSVWVFGDTFSTKRTPDNSFLSSTWSWTRDTSAADGTIGPFEQSPDPNAPNDPQGAAKQLIPYDSAGLELAFNAFHQCDQNTSGPGCPCAADDDQCGDRFALWPGPVIAYRDNANVQRALLFYSELYVHPGDYDYTIRGTSIARWDDPRQPVTRAFPTVFSSSDPTMTAAAIKFTSGGIEYLYAYACTPRPGTLNADCVLGRAPFVRTRGADALSAILDRAQWKFYAGPDPQAASSWVSDPAQSVRVLDASTTLSIQYNAFLGAYTAIYSQFATNDVYLQTAPRPEGPWSGHTTPLFDVGPVEDGKFDYYAIAHSEFDAAADSGQRGEVIYVTTAHPDPDNIFRMPMRLFELTLR
jgi:hypothetical protein